MDNLEIIQKIDYLVAMLNERKEKGRWQLIHKHNGVPTVYSPPEDC